MLINNNLKYSIALLLASLPIASQANLITNGNFATGTSASWSMVGVATVIPYSLYGMSGSYAGSSYGAVYGYGDQPASGVLSQTISTVSGTTYALSFAYGSFSGNSSLTQSMHVTAADTATSGVLLSQNISTTGSGTTLVTMYTLAPTFNFTATGSSTTLSFADISANTIAVDGFLTGISVTQTSTQSTIPDPGTLALAGIGLVWMAVGAKKNRILGKNLNKQ